MKKLFYFIFLCLTSLLSPVNAQDLQLFRIYEFAKENNDTVAFISLSDIYPLSDHPDSLPIPGKLENARHVNLEAKYRKMLLDGSKVSETDKVFIYDYANDILQTFAVKDLPAAAWLTVYENPDECPCSHHYYMIGFEINRKLLKGFTTHNYTTLIYIGKKSPFIRGKLNPITWKEIEPEEYHTAIAEIKDTAGLPTPARGQVYAYETEELQYFVQDESLNGISLDRYLLILKTKTKEIVYKHKYSDGESSSPAPLNAEYHEQWTGPLFKNKPTVIFGFTYHSFGCPYITVLGEPVSYIGINCDNRH
ncbi:MAG TPA: oxidoreductase [Bacteroidia bacterium]|nr:oxidoreductase [Bacteroidia bacterium]